MDIITKKAGNDKTKFKQRVDWLLTCNEPHFVKPFIVDDETIQMPRYDTWYGRICNQDIDKSMSELERLVDIVDSWQTDKDGKFELLQFDASNYFEKLHQLTGFNYSCNEFKMFDSYGFVHGNLTISNILMDGDEFRFINPSGKEEIQYYDYGKLMQSFDFHWEKYNNDIVTSNYYEFCKQTAAYMRRNFDVAMLEFFEVVHLLCTVSFARKNNKNELANELLEEGHNIFDRYGIKYDCEEVTE